ncbi:uncharacterized protein Tco025E_02272 [Trypanosoma conorhini]|uniref:Uncharacterized protein n=1 Tax=Trypanosoma conorhini TaxID=83891 RepID=A0A422Q5Y4_9TRYP|nr:uncharacterized protein Tco025E_02272 [Trypanosoma conorhini]RNF25368.1 hypothetical protein Tco025E_02272 [Trypanosoma conorhini]
MRRNACKFMQETILPTVIQLGRRQQEQQAPGEHRPAARVAVVDIKDASAYFDLYTFAQFFGIDGASVLSGAVEGLELLACVEEMVKSGRVMPGTRTDLEVPVVLLFRPGAAAYLRKGRQWTPQQIAETTSLRMLADVAQMEPFIAEVPQGTVASPLSLPQHLLADYERCLAAPPRTRASAAANQRAAPTVTRPLTMPRPASSPRRSCGSSRGRQWRRCAWLPCGCGGGKRKTPAAWRLAETCPRRIAWER